LEVRVELDRAKLDAHNLTLAEVEGRLRAANVDISAGTLQEGGEVYLVRGLARFRRPEDVAQVVLRYGAAQAVGSAPLRVADVATVRLVPREIDHLVRVDGNEGVGLSVFKEADANTVTVSRTVREALERLTADLPGVEVREVTDEAALVEDAISDVQGAALIGMALAVLVLVVFLRSAGPTLLVSAALPVSLLSTLFLMHLAGQSLNLMTLGGLALGAGMLVDNAIVVVESIFRRLAGGEAKLEAAAQGTAEVGAAITSSTLTHCAVFLPVIFVQGIAARLVSGLAFTVVVSVLASLVVAVLLIPALAPWVLPRPGRHIVDPGIGRVERWVGALLRHPALVTAVSLVLCAGAVWALTGLGTELLPPADPRQFSLRLVGPPGQRVQATAAVVESAEAILREAAGGDVRAVLSEVGRLPDDDRQIRQEQTEQNTARILVRLAAGGRTARQIVATAAPAVQRLGDLEVGWEVGSSALARAVGTTGPPIVVELNGQSLEELRLGAETLRARLAELPELWNVSSSFEGGPPELRVVLDRAIADGLGIDLDTVAATLQTALDGRQVTVLTTGDEERNVVLRLPRVRRDELAGLTVRAANGARVRVGEVARIVPEAGAREVFRRDQRRIAQVTARVAPGHEFPAATAGVRRVLASMEMPPGTWARLAGEEEERARTFGELSWAGALAVLLVFMVLAATFESLIHPLTVAMAIPLSLVGVALVLVPMGRPVGVMELLGLIVLAGVATNDAILLVDAAQRLMQQGLAAPAALARAAGIRLRPILMTTATTVLAMVPLAVGQSEAARLRSPMALTVIGGLIASLVGSLAVVPCVYLLLDRLRPARFRR
ncbi:MAG TPA: efflux RND transporter permease subunit, partial [Candidatus Polarisedimenticolaceae bacterium]|nr:efflux RND transporter permease subunit [Candidatus Polarisedimenticolaceae bacterium]